MWKGGVGWGQSKKSKPILALSRGVRLRCEAKILSHPRPTTFVGRGKPMQGEARKGGLSRAGKNCHPYWLLFNRFWLGFLLFDQVSSSFSSSSFHLGWMGWSVLSVQARGVNLVTQGIDLVVWSVGLISFLIVWSSFFLSLSLPLASIQA